MELYGNIVYKTCNEIIKRDNPNISEEDEIKLTFNMLHEKILEGFDAVKCSRKGSYKRFGF